MVTPDGMVSVNAAVNVVAAALGLPSVIVSVAVPPAAIVAGTIDLPSVGTNRMIELVSDADAVEPGPLLAVFVAFTVLVIVGADMPALKFTGSA